MLEWCPFTESFLNVQFKYFHFLHILSAAPCAHFGHSILWWPLKHQHPMGSSSGQGSELRLQQGRHFCPVHILPHQSSPASHGRAGFHPTLFSSWKLRIIWVLFWCYPSALILGSYLKGLMILQRSHGTLSHGPSPSSRFHHQPPQGSRPVLLLSCPTMASADTGTPLSLPGPVSRLHRILWQLLIHSRLCSLHPLISSPLPSTKMHAKVSENTGVWKVDTLKLCKHDKPCRALLQINPHHTSPTTYSTTSHGHNRNPTICTPSPSSLL